jgi:hypothetical protein
MGKLRNVSTSRRPQNVQQASRIPDAALATSLVNGLDVYNLTNHIAWLLDKEDGLAAPLAQDGGRYRNEGSAFVEDPLNPNQPGIPDAQAGTRRNVIVFE